MSIVQVLRRDVYPRLDHRKVFGELEGWTETPLGALAACPICGAGAAFLMEPNRAHGFCEKKCGRVSWWGLARRGRKLEPLEAMGWLAGEARFELPEMAEARFDAFEQAERRADVVEAVVQLCRAHARRTLELLDRFGLAKLSDIGSYPGDGSLVSRLRRYGIEKSEVDWLLPQAGSGACLVAAHRGFEGEGLGIFTFELHAAGVVERFLVPAPLPPPLLPFRFNEVVGCRALVLTERAWDCLQVLASGLRESCSLIPGLAESPQLAVLMDWRIGTLYLEPDRLHTHARVQNVRDSGVAVPFVLRFEPGGLESTLASRPGQRLLEEAEHGTFWELKSRLARHAMDSEAGRENAATEVYLDWRDCDSPLEKEQMIEALASATGRPAGQLLEEFRVRTDRQRKTHLEKSYRELFEAGSALAGQGRFEELKEMLFQKNAEIAGRTFLERLEPFEPDRFFRSVKRLPEGVKTGYPDLDRYIRILPGELIVLGARPSHGKTTFAINLLFNMLNFNKLFRREEPFIFFSYELTEEFLAAKLLSRMTGRHSFYQVLEYLRSGLRTDPLLEDGLVQLKAFGPFLYLVCKPRMTAEDILGFCQSVYLKHGSVGGVLVDYLQIVGTPTPLPTREQEIQYIIKHLRIAAQEFQTPIFSLAQAMRAGADEGLSRPGIQHLMDGRIIEQESNTILMLYNPEIQKAQQSRTDMLVEQDIVPLELVVRKNKYGAINRIIQLEYKMRTNEIKNRGGFVSVYEI